MTLRPVCLVNLGNNERLSLPDWQTRHAGKAVHAVAGIGNPSRFFTSLREYGFDIMPHAFADHHAFIAADFAFAGEDSVVMTAKDAVKCAHFARPQWWMLEVEPVLPAGFYTTLQRLLADKH
jgi:tetraacyldisaccharide 4'-kinase